MCETWLINRHEAPDIQLHHNKESATAHALCLSCGLHLTEDIPLEEAREAVGLHEEWHEWFLNAEPLLRTLPQCACLDDMLAYLSPEERSIEIDARVGLEDAYWTIQNSDPDAPLVAHEYEMVLLDPTFPISYAAGLALSDSNRTEA